MLTGEEREREGALERPELAKSARRGWSKEFAEGDRGEGLSKWAIIMGKGGVEGK